MAVVPHSKLYRNLAVAALGVTLVVILWGAFVRASGSGAGCGDHWPLCNGTVIPQAPVLATIIEYTHRLTSGLAMIFAAVLAFLAFRWFPRRHPVRFGAGISLGVMLVEAGLGAGLVLLQLVAGDDSGARAGAISLHLVNTLLLVAAQSFTIFAAQRAMTLTDSRIQPRNRDSLWTLIGLVLGGFLLVGASGAIVALGDTLFPAASLAAGFQQDFAAGSHFLLKLRVWHPVLAVGVTGAIALLGVHVRRFDLRPRVQTLSLLVSFLALTQIALGLANMALLAPVWMQLVHLAMADVTWICLVALATEVLLYSEGREVAESSSVASSRITSDFLRPSVKLKN